MRVHRNGVIRGVMISLATLLAFFASLAAMADDVQHTDLAKVRDDLSVVDQALFVRDADPKQAVQFFLEKTDIKTRDIYRAYLEKATKITDELIMVRHVMEQQQGELSLQQLGSLLQALKAQNRNFQDAFEHGEDEFRSYQLIQTAINNLDDAWRYWRSVSLYRPGLRASALNELEDDRILRVRLQAAQQAIEDLHEIQEVRQALDRDARFEWDATD